MRMKMKTANAAAPSSKDSRIRQYRPAFFTLLVFSLAFFSTSATAAIPWWTRCERLLQERMNNLPSDDPQRKTGSLVFVFTPLESGVFLRVNGVGWAAVADDGGPPTTASSAAWSSPTGSGSSGILNTRAQNGRTAVQWSRTPGTGDWFTNGIRPTLDQCLALTADDAPSEESSSRISSSIQLDPLGSTEVTAALCDADRASWQCRCRAELLDAKSDAARILPMMASIQVTLTARIPRAQPYDARIDSRSGVKERGVVLQWTRRSGDMTALISNVIHDGAKDYSWQVIPSAMIRSLVLATIAHGHYADITTPLDAAPALRAFFVESFKPSIDKCLLWESKSRPAGPMHL